MRPLRSICLAGWMHDDRQTVLKELADSEGPSVCFLKRSRAPVGLEVYVYEDAGRVYATPRSLGWVPANLDENGAPHPDSISNRVLAELQRLGVESEIDGVYADVFVEIDTIIDGYAGLQARVDILVDIGGYAEYMTARAEGQICS